MIIVILIDAVSNWITRTWLFARLQEDIVALINQNLFCFYTVPTGYPIVKKLLKPGL
jgi:hypothetical protein